MNNIHILPTEKPSRFYKRNSDSSFDFSTSLYPEIGNSKNQNIYITSDEEIKEGDWFLTDDKRVEKFAPDWRAREWHKKIILTTDQDLIKDGVQAIDDEFLEWFVKNPSCEEFTYEEYMSGKYLIRKEEPTIVRFPTYYESKQELEKEMFELEQQLDIPSNLRWHNSKPKQETLEEAFYRIRKSIDYEEFDFTSFELGAKWQQKQDKNLYSLDNLKEAFAMGRTNATIKDFNTKFKNK